MGRFHSKIFSNQHKILEKSLIFMKFMQWKLYMFNLPLKALHPVFQGALLYHQLLHYLALSMRVSFPMSIAFSIDAKASVMLL
jgi:hypothetical protein